MEPETPQPEKPAKQSLLERDLRWLVRHAAWVGFGLAMICHTLPPHYRVVCHKVAHACMLGH